MKRYLLNSCLAVVFAVISASFVFAAPQKATVTEIVGGEIAVGTNVVVEGTVYYCDPVWRFYFLGDQNEFIFVEGSQGNYLELGTRVRFGGQVMDGHSKVKIFADSAQVEIIGHDSVGSPSEVDISDLETGDFDASWVRTNAIVEYVVIESQRVWLHCVSCDENEKDRIEFTACLPLDGDFTEVAPYVGATVQLSGSLGLSIDRYDEAEGLLIFLTDSVETIKEPADELKLTQCSALGELVAGTQEDAFFLSSGQVTFCREEGFFLEDNVSGSWVCSPQRTSRMTPGANVEVMGFIRRDSQHNVHLEARICRHTNTESLKEPRLASIVSVFRDRPEARRVRMQGAIISHFYIDGEILLELESEETEFGVTMPATEEVYRSLNLDSALVAAVAGTCSFDRGGSHFSLYVPSVADFQVVDRNSSISLGKVGIVLAAVIFLLASCFLWGKSLQHQVRTKTADLSTLTAELRALLDSIQDGILFVGNNQCIRAVNDKALSVFDVKLANGDAAEVVGEKLSKVGVDAEFLSNWNRLNQNEEEHTELKLSLTNPQERSLEVFTTPVADAKKNHVGRVWAFYDVTERQVLQESLAHAQKQEAIGRVAGGFAHDFNNLLTGIIGSLSVMRMSPELTVEESDEQLETALGAAERAASLVSQLLGFSRKTRLDLRINNVNDIIRQLEALLRPSFGSSIKLEFDLLDQLPNVNVDATQLEQVLLNVCLNARDALPDGGRVIVSTKARVRCRIGESVPREFVEISIRDTGLGIPPDVRSKIFEPFFTTKQGNGTGLGLAMCDGIVSQHDGWIQCESAESKGTEFRIFLPSTQLTVANRRTDSAVINASLKGTTILVVDDEALVRTVSTKILQSQGVVVQTAESGDEAIAYLMQNSDAIDLVLLDWTMPGMSGKETLLRIKEDWPRLPTIICSGYVFDTDTVARQAKAVPDAVIQKPFTSKRLTNEIHRVLQIQGSGELAKSA